MGSGIWIVITPLALLIGIGIGFWIGRLQQGGTEDRLDEVEKEFEAYKSKVTEHFSQSAAHFNSIGQQYRELYEHMANGSKNLCLDGEAGHRFPAPEMVAAVSHATSDAQTHAVIDAEVAAEEIPEPQAAATEDPTDTTPDAGTDSEASIEEDDVAAEAANDMAEPEAANDSVEAASDPATTDKPEGADAEPPASSEEDKEPRLYH